MVERKRSAASIQIRLHLGAPNAQFQLGIYDYAPYCCCSIVQHLLVLPGVLLTQCFRPCLSRRFESKPQKDKSMARPAHTYVANSRHCYCYAVLKR